MAGITSTKKIKGQPHLLAYITPNEVEKLKTLGGQETMTPEGIPAYPEFDNYTEVGGGTRAEFEGGAYGGTGNAGDGVIQQYKNQGVDPSLQEAVKKQTKINKAIKDAEDARKAGFRTTASQVYSPPTFAQNFKNSLYQNSLNRNKVLAMRKMSLMRKGLPGMYGALISGVTGKVPDWAQNMSVQELEALAGDIQGIKDYNQATYNKDLNASNKTGGLNLLNRVDEGQTLLDKGLMTQTDYERLFPSNIINPIDGGNPYILPQYAMMGGGADMGSEDVEEKTYDYRLGDPNANKALDVTLGQYFNQGGRVPRAFGGIMDSTTGRKAYGLGSIFKSIGKAAKKVLSSDIGKAAIAGAAIYYGGGGRMPFTKAFAKQGFGGFSLGPSTGGFFSKSNPLLFSANKAGEQVFNPLKFAGLITAGGALAGPAKVDQMPGDDGRRGGRLKDSRGNEVIPSKIRAEIDEAYESGDPEQIKRIEDYYAFLSPTEQYLPYSNYGSQGYRTTVATGGRIRAEEGGLMNLGGMEKDYRAEGGFVPIGKQEKADDVPARLSVNEFVFTADAVRNAGGGDIDKGAEVMENMMKNLENGGRVSEESQGNAGAQEMFSVSERIGEVI